MVFGGMPEVLGEAVDVVGGVRCCSGPGGRGRPGAAWPAPPGRCRGQDGNKPPVNTRSSSPGRCGANSPVSTAGTRASPGRLPHRLRPPVGHLPPGTSQPGPGWPLPGLLPYRGRGSWPGSPRARAAPAPPDPAARLPSTAPAPWVSPHANSATYNSASARAADVPVESPLRGPLRSGEHGQRVRSWTRHAPLPLPRTGKGRRPARSDVHRRHHRTPQRTSTHRGSMTCGTPVDGLLHFILRYRWMCAEFRRVWIPGSRAGGGRRRGWPSRPRPEARTASSAGCGSRSPPTRCTASS